MPVSHTWVAVTIMDPAVGACSFSTKVDAPAGRQEPLAGSTKLRPLVTPPLSVIATSQLLGDTSGVVIRPSAVPGGERDVSTLTMTFLSAHRKGVVMNKAKRRYVLCTP